MLETGEHKDNKSICCKKLVNENEEVDGLEPLDLTGGLMTQEENGFRIVADSNGTCSSQDLQKNCLDDLEDEDQEDIPLAFLSTCSQSNSQNKKKKKKKSKKNKNPFNYKKKKKFKSKDKMKSRTKCKTKVQLLVNENLSLSNQAETFLTCTAEEADSSSEQIQIISSKSQEINHLSSEQSSTTAISTTVSETKNQIQTVSNKCDETVESSSDQVPAISSNLQEVVKSSLEQAKMISSEFKQNKPSLSETSTTSASSSVDLVELSAKEKAVIQENGICNGDNYASEYINSNECDPHISRTSKRKKKKKDFYLTSPYKRGSNGWEDCLRPRPAQVQHYQSILMKKANLFEKEVNKKRKIEDNKLKELSVSVLNCAEDGDLYPDYSDQDEEDGTPLEAAVGEIVWAKLGSTRWWPAMVIWGKDCGQPPARSGHTWVFWFGDHKISELPRDKLLDFVSDFSTKYSDFAGKMFSNGVLEAVREIAGRVNYNYEEEDMVKLLKWAKGGFITESKRPNLYGPDPNNPIPDYVRKQLNRIKTQYLLALESYNNNMQQQPRFSRFQQLENSGSALKKVKEGLLKIEDICIACDSSDQNIVVQHPLIEGGLCKNCREDIVETMFAYGDDGSNAYCVLCGQAGELSICDSNNCNRCYCTGCIEVLVAPGAHKKVLQTDPWLCYMCTDFDPELNGLIRKKENWQTNVMNLFRADSHMTVPSMDDYKEKKGIRVLSLFDGIGTGKYVLELLGLEVEAYFASETDIDAINVTKVQHKGSVTHLGQIEDITDSMVADLCPIDLLIGGSPCNDLSLVNPIRKGLYDHTGTGKLFFDFYRILKTIQLANKGRHLFWLFENVASMPQEYKKIITRFLQCEPCVIDSKYFTPQNRARYFWGNIPGMYTPLQPHLLEQSITLESVLTPYLDRKPVVEKIRTVTTRSNSLKQGKKWSVYPVTMNGDGDTLWVTEIEEVFGFPRHYTDVGNIPLSRRHSMLGKCWSVPVIKHLFTPLRNFFKSVTPDLVNSNRAPSPSSSTSLS